MFWYTHIDRWVSPPSLPFSSAFFTLPILLILLQPLFVVGVVAGTLRDATIIRTFWEVEEEEESRVEGGLMGRVTECTTRRVLILLLFFNCLYKLHTHAHT